MSKGRSKSRRSGSGRERRISVRAVRRDPPDLKKLSRALIALALAQAEKEAQESDSTRSAGEKGRGA